MLSKSDRRQFIKKATYVVPAIFTLDVALVEASAASKPPKGPKGSKGPKGPRGPKGDRGQRAVERQNRRITRDTL